MSIVPAYNFKDDLKNVHLNGNLEYYMDNRVSVRGDANYMLGSSGLTTDSIGLKDNISVMLGSVFHLPSKGHFDPYFILQPGIAYTSSFREKYTIGTESNSVKTTYYAGTVSPLASAGLGFNYYFQRFAHLFVETRYVYGRHLSEAPAPVLLQELRITFGLGFNVFAAKEKRKPV